MGRVAGLTFFAEFGACVVGWIANAGAGDNDVHVGVEGVWSVRLRVSIADGTAIGDGAEEPDPDCRKDNVPALVKAHPSRPDKAKQKEGKATKQTKCEYDLRAFLQAGEIFVAHGARLVV